MEFSSVSHLGVTDFGFFPPTPPEMYSFFRLIPFFKMLLSICISYMFQVICLISYLVFKLEVVVMAGCQMFRLSCLQHILMWIYWWMRRKFLIKSTVQKRTPVSFNEVLNNIAVCTELFGSSCSFANVSVHHSFEIAALCSHATDIADSVVSCSWLSPLALNIAVLLLLTQFWPDSSEQFYAKLHFKTPCFWGSWNLTMVHWWFRQNHQTADGCASLRHPKEQNYSFSRKWETEDKTTRVIVEATGATWHGDVKN